MDVGEHQSVVELGVAGNWDGQTGETTLTEHFNQISVL